MLKRVVPSEFVPKCPKCGRPMSMNLRSDNTFVQDAGWDEAAKRYERFLEDNKHKRNYICINKGQADIPSEIKKKAICVDADISRVITDIKWGVGK